MNDEITRLRDELAQVEARIAALDEECARTDGSTTNPEGEIGGIRSRSRRQKDRIFDRWDRQAQEWRGLARRRDDLTARLRAAEQAPARAAAAATLQDRCRSLRPGDRVWAGYPEPGTVVRVNVKSLTVRTPGGRRERVELGHCAPVGVGA